MLPALLLFALAAVPPHETPRSSFDVLHYDARVEPDLSGKAVAGRVFIDFISTTDALEAVEFDIGALTIESAGAAGQALAFSSADRRLQVRLNRPAARGERRRLEIVYRGAPRFGLEFVPGKSQVYTIFSTSQWMPCVDAPADKATLRLGLVLPAGLVAVASGRPIEEVALEGGRVLHQWRLDEPMPTYTFGFAAGKFTEVTDRHGRTRLKYLSTDASAQELRRVFADTKDMLAFFEERSGVGYGAGEYTQALVEKTIGQELAGFSLMSEEYGRAVLADPTSVGLLAHELAHQWWGNRVTCLDWTHFWLNEGFATFMAAAYREKRFGREAYLRDVEGWRARYERVRAAGKDRSLVFPDWNRPTADDRALVYQKGALVLHELRERIGDAAFWRGIRAYTRAHLQGSVVTDDFERAMATSTRQDLSAFFDQWIHAGRRPGP